MAKVKKKSVKKRAVKTKPAKSKVEVTIKKQVLGEAPEEYHFVVADGKKLKNLKELVHALDTMSDEVFRSHVNEFKNDFANWTKDILKEDELSKQIVKLNSKIDTQMAVMKHMIKKLTD